MSWNSEQIVQIMFNFLRSIIGSGMLCCDTLQWFAAIFTFLGRFLSPTIYGYTLAFFFRNLFNQSITNGWVTMIIFIFSFCMYSDDRVFFLKTFIRWVLGGNKHIRKSKGEERIMCHKIATNVFWQNKKMWGG